MGTNFFVKTMAELTGSLPSGSNNIGKVDAQLTGSKAQEYEFVTISNSAVGLTPATYGTHTKAMITVEDATFRFRVDGDNPEANEGHLVQIGDVIQLTSNEDIVNFRAIRNTDTNSKIRVTYSD